MFFCLVLDWAKSQLRYVNSAYIMSVPLNLVLLVPFGHPMRYKTCVVFISCVRVPFGQFKSFDDCKKGTRGLKMKHCLNRDQGT